MSVIVSDSNMVQVSTSDIGDFERRTLSEGVPPAEAAPPVPSGADCAALVAADAETPRAGADRDRGLIKGSAADLIHPLGIHPIANIFPMMTTKEVADLAEDIAQHGQREPIWIYQRKILDGRNRDNACRLKGLEPRIAEYVGPDPVAFAVSMNLKRRQLDDGQRSIVAARLASFKRGDNQHAPNGGTTQAQSAQMLNVSKRGVQRARSLLADGALELVAAVERGDLTISAAAGFVKSTSPHLQANLIEEHGSAEAAVKAAVKAKADRAASKVERSAPDPKRAADRADRQWERSNCLDHVLQAFRKLERSGNASQVANAVEQTVGGMSRAETVYQLRRLAGFAGGIVRLLEEPSPSAANTPAVASVG